MQLFCILTHPVSFTVSHIAIVTFRHNCCNQSLLGQDWLENNLSQDKSTNAFITRSCYVRLYAIKKIIVLRFCRSYEVINEQSDVELKPHCHFSANIQIFSTINLHQGEFVYYYIYIIQPILLSRNVKYLQKSFYFQNQIKDHTIYFHKTSVFLQYYL